MKKLFFIVLETKNDNWILNHLDKFNCESLPLFSSEFEQGISLKRIYEIESKNNKPITLIAVTRNQYDNSNFDKYESYIKEHLEISNVYFGLWHDGKKTEHDVLYALPTNDYEEVQVHLNMHNGVNGGLAQVMGLEVDSDSNTKAILNTNFNAY